MIDYKLCLQSDIVEDESKEFVIERDGNQKSIMAVRRDGALYLYVNSCPHIGVPLNMAPDRFLDVENRFIQCATHGALFKVEDGECVHGPCLGKFLQPIPFELKGEEVFISKTF